MANQFVFSTGTFKMGPQGNTPLDDSHLINAVQDVNADNSFTRAEVFGPNQVSVYSIAQADHSAKQTLKVTVNDIQLKQLPYLVGATHNVVSATDEYVIGQTSVPQFCRVEFQAVDQLGKVWQYTATNAKPKGFSFSAKVQGFADQPIEVDCYPDPNALDPIDGETARAGAVAFWTRVQ